MLFAHRFLGAAHWSQLEPRFGRRRTEVTLKTQEDAEYAELGNHKEKYYLKHLRELPRSPVLIPNRITTDLHQQI